MKIIYVVNEERYFISHRLRLAQRAVDRGWEVVLVALPSGRGVIPDVRCINLGLDRGGFNLIKDLMFCFRLCRLYRDERPDLVHHVTLKPVLYGSVAAFLCRTRCVVNALAGLGSLVTSKNWRVKAVRPIIGGMLRLLLNRKGSALIVQNRDDLEEMRSQLGVSEERIRLTQGSGVDLAEFKPGDGMSRNERPLVVMVSRLLLEKGVFEFVEAARILNSRNISARFALVGEPDVENPHSVCPNRLEKVAAQGGVELWGHRSDICQVYRESSIAVLPSYYREGIPKSLLEAAASGLPIVTTDSPGCREVVDDGDNGFLVPVRDPRSLSVALEKLIESPSTMKRMGIASREKSLKQFDVERVTDITFDLYSDLFSVK